MRVYMKVIVRTEKEMELKRYFVLRGIKDTCVCKTVVAERKYASPPPALEIAEFINECGCDFVSLVENFYLEDESELPFS